MVEGLYNKEVVCPVCSQKFQATKVKARACKVKSRDSDFCVHYEGINPILYDPGSAKTAATPTSRRSLKR